MKRLVEPWKKMTREQQGVMLQRLEDRVAMNIAATLTEGANVSGLHLQELQLSQIVRKEKNEND